MAAKKKESPILLIKIALNAALFACNRVNQKLIKKKEESPTPSQPIKAVIKSSLATKTHIKTLNTIICAKNIRRRGSLAMYSVENSNTEHVIITTTQSIRLFKELIFIDKLTEPEPKLNHNQEKTPGKSG